LPFSITSRIKPIFYIEKLKALNAKDKAEYHDFALKCLKGYIENNPSWRKDIIDLQALLGFALFNGFITPFSTK
jgi:hypothetical protein